MEGDRTEKTENETEKTRDNITVGITIITITTTTVRREREDGKREMYRKRDDDKKVKKKRYTANKRKLDVRVWCEFKR